jgi:DNA-binding XRE family transcriptional regulator
MSEEQGKYEVNKLPVIKNKIKEILAQRNMTQNDLASALDMSVGNVSNIVNNKIQVTLPLAFKISYLLDMPIDDIFYDEESLEKDYINHVVETEGMLEFYLMKCILMAKGCVDMQDVIDNIRNKSKVNMFKIRLNKIQTDDMD